jgi:sensor c-di-GMP phosphodiesterase-like protein
VENEAQLMALKALGCDQYQGYYCSPALPAAEFEQLVRRQAAGRSVDLHDLEDTSSKLTALRAG